MRWTVLVLLLAASAFAQFDLPPQRLDDTLSGPTYYPLLQIAPQGDLRCIWGSAGTEWLRGFGQHMGFDGARHGPRVNYENLPVGQQVCPPQILIAALSDGGEARLISHS